MKKFIVSFLLAFLLPALAVAAPAYVTTAGSYSNGSGGLDFSVNCTGANRALFVAIGGNGSNFPTVVTHNSVAMTKVGDSGTGNGVSLWMLSNPDTGLQNIHIVSDNFVVTGIALCFSGAHQTTASLIGTPSISTSNTIVVSSATDELVLAVAGAGGDIATCQGSGQTNVGSAFDGSNFSGVFSSLEVGASSVTMDWTCGSVGGHIGVGIKPVASAPATGKGSLRRTWR